MIDPNRRDSPVECSEGTSPRAERIKTDRRDAEHLVRLLVAGRPRQRATKRDRRPALTTQPLKANLIRLLIEDRRDNLRGMNIQTHQGPSLRHVGASY